MALNPSHADAEDIEGDDLAHLILLLVTQEGLLPLLQSALY